MDAARFRALTPPRAQFALAPKTAHEMVFNDMYTVSMEAPYQVAGMALAGHAAKDIAVSVRAASTRADKRDALKLSGWQWAAGSVLNASHTLANKHKDSDISWAVTAAMGAFAATLLAKGYGLDEEELDIKL